MTGADDPATRHRVAVLPFASISPDPADEFFADGMTEELISTLSRLAGLRVIARTSSMKFKGSKLGVAEIGRELSVQSVLEGSVRKEGNRVRITAQLIEVRSEEHLWSQEYERDLTGVFEIQRDLAQRIARSLRVRIREREARDIERAKTRVAEAYTLYLKGKHAANQRSEAALREGVRLFELTLERDPSFALAHSALADCYASLALLEVEAPSLAFPRARDAAHAALRIDPDLAEAHASLGLVRFQYDRDWAASEAEFRRALELNANYPAAHQFYADYLKAMGRFDEALAEMRRALELDPLSLAINTGFGHVLYLSRDYEAAIAQYRKALEMDPTFVTAHLWFGRPYLQTGRFEEAIREIQRAVDLSNRSTICLAVLGHAFASAGRRTEAVAVLDELVDRAKTRYLPSYWIALVYAGLADVPKALEWLERASEERSSWIVWIGVEPRFDPLRSEPRFQALIDRMGLRAVDARSRSASAPSEESRIATWLADVPEVRLSRHRVAGIYTRYSESARQELKDFRQRLFAGFESSRGRIDSFLIWAPPGSGKTFLIREIAGELGDRVHYEEINLAETTAEPGRRRFAEVGALPGPALILVDEVDSPQAGSWAYEALLPVLEPPQVPPAPRAFVLIGSGGGSLEGLLGSITGRPKGSDLCSRVPHPNRLSLPPTTGEDRVLIAVANLLGPRAQRTVSEAERLALLYIAVRPDLANPRQLREFISHALERLPPGEERLKFDHLFDAGDPENKAYWTRASTIAPRLMRRFVPIARD